VGPTCEFDRRGLRSSNSHRRASSFHTLLDAVKTCARASWGLTELAAVGTLLVGVLAFLKRYQEYRGQGSTKRACCGVRRQSDRRLHKSDWGKAAQGLPDAEKCRSSQYEPMPNSVNTMIPGGISAKR